jgi:mitofilin
MDKTKLGLAIICIVLATLLVISIVSNPTAPIGDNNKINELESENQRLQNSVDTLQNENKKLQNTMDTLQNENKKLQNTINTLQNENKKPQETNNNLQSENQRLQNTINTLQNENKKLQDTNNTLQNKSQELQNTINTLQNENQELQNTINTLQNENQELRAITNLAKVTTIQNKYTFNQQAGQSSPFTVNTPYAGYIFVRIDSSTTNLAFARVRYTSNGGNSPHTITYDQRESISSSGGYACFPVLPGTTTVYIGNTNLINGATHTVTIEYWY